MIFTARHSTAPLRPRMRLARAAVALLALAATQAQAQSADVAQSVASLYPPQPSANAAYLRVVNTAPIALRVSVPGSIGAAVQDVPRNGATRLSVVTPGQALQIVPLGQAPLPALSVAGGHVLTLALRHDAQGWHATPVLDQPERGDGLKATLRAFNFAAGCTARITLGADGPQVFDALAPATVRTRAINPVAATLVGHCGSGTAALELPALRSGDSYSLWLGGDAAHPTLTGVLDTVAWPPAAR
jgi:alginate O-acetyltransferase complex protein AlgF